MANRKDSTGLIIITLLVLFIVVKAVEYWTITVPGLVCVLALLYLWRRARGAAGLTSGSSSIDDFQVEIVGESRYQHNLLTICGGRTEEGANKVVPARCVPDSGAGSVRVEIQGKIVGTLDDEESESYLTTFGSRSAKCQALIRGGWDRGDGDVGNFGVRLNLDLG
jgi:hypothetical protein